MRKHMKIILIACGVGIPIIAFLCYLYFPWVTFPTKSSPHMLTLARYTYLSTNKITLKHYVNDKHISDYVLELKTGMGIQGTQSYKLPHFEEGKVEVSVELEDELNSNITTTYNQAQDLYEKGLLIYFTDNDSEYFIVNGKSLYDRYVYFVSRTEKLCYFREAYSSEWAHIDGAPPLKRFAREQMGYFPLAYEWKENEWVVLPANSNHNN